MEIHLYRSSLQSVTTTGNFIIDDSFECLTLEDRVRKKKIYGETAISAGKYQLGIREYGSHHKKYLKKFPGIHRGMIQVLGVENFTDILIHIGNTHVDSLGCILVGNGVSNNKLVMGELTDSTGAYISMYKKVIAAFDRGEIVTIEIHNLNKMY